MNTEPITEGAKKNKTPGGVMKGVQAQEGLEKIEEV